LEADKLRYLFADKLREEIIKYNEPLSGYTTLGIGGGCDAMVSPENLEEIAKIVKICQKENIPLTVIGRGSNLLVRDGGIRGVVVRISDNFSYSTISGDTLTVQSGALLTGVARRALNNSLTGLEFASGIPGTVGGAVHMNAGAYGGEISDILEYSVYMDFEGEIYRLGASEHKFAYRSSFFSGTDHIIIESSFRLKPGKSGEIRKKMADLNRRRREKQPLTLPSAGSVFKRPEGHFAGALIERCGLMGCRFGGVSVSKKHAGFIVNDNNGTAADMEKLIRHIQKTVYDETGMKLVPEIKIIGER
jgi:UDP-N-acetylmuramate dehydrogenase